LKWVVALKRVVALKWVAFAAMQGFMIQRNGSQEDSTDNDDDIDDAYDE
jgi:hypothetical protein